MPFREEVIVDSVIAVFSAATLPTLPFTASCVDGDRHGNLVSDPSLAFGGSLLVGLGTMAYSVVKKDWDPAKRVFAGSAALALANVVGGKIKNFRLPPA